MKHLITTADFSNEEILKLFDDAKMFLDLKSNNLLQGKIIVTLFFENSTRTRSSFEIAAKRLGAEVVNLEVQTSSTKKGETVEDTIANLDAMKPDAIIIRHSDCGLPASLVKFIKCPILNAGDGRNAHPTQALLDLYTIMDHYNYDVDGKNVAIVGDIVNSRVASSNLELLPRFGINPILVSPKIFNVVSEYKSVKNIKKVIDDIDIILSLRVQHERHNFSRTQEELEKSTKKYAKKYCITKDIIQNRDLIVLHPGPVNRNIDISDEVLLDSRSKVLEQVTNGVAIRMACLKKLILNQ
ncbi:aspartate carbamoyltransferase catalytic subunit [Arcobacter sp. 15-2]|uniref:aspartate carbamoyltransferase catalytic subunit n=1 Tax=Arcobacter sp. 15-2 TaxID=3374109 RepID=UPI00399C6B83